MHKSGEMQYGYLKMIKRYMVVRADDIQHADDGICYSELCELRVCFRSRRLMHETRVDMYSLRDTWRQS